MEDTYLRRLRRASLRLVLPQSPPLPTDRAASRRHLLAAGAAVAALTVLLVLLVRERSYFGYGTETDTLAGMLTNAEAVLTGRPLNIGFHPPLYSFALALGYLIVPEWFTVGRAVSVASAAVLLGASFLLFRHLGGVRGGWGALLALATSVPFLAYAATATSDVFFAALYTLSLVAAAYATKRPSTFAWLAVGLLVGATLLTRTNGIVLIPLLLLPLLLPAERGRRAARIGVAVLACGAVLGAWVAWGSASGSNLWPRATYQNLALTYFSPSEDRIGGDARIEAAQRFEGVWDVITHDPAHMAETYLKDGYSNLKSFFAHGRLVAFPLNLLALPGLLLLFALRPTPFAFGFIGVTLLHLALLNLKAFEARYYLFLVPLLGAAAGCCYGFLADRALRGWRGPLAVAAVLILIPALYYGIDEARWRLTRDADELAQAVPRLQGVVPEGSLIITRKPHAGYYTDSRAVLPPDVGSSDELRPAVERLIEERGAGAAGYYFFFGKVEASTRPALARLRNPAGAPSWLVPLAAGRGGGGWALYRISLPGARSRRPSPPAASSPARAPR